MDLTGLLGLKAFEQLNPDVANRMQGLVSPQSWQPQATPPLTQTTMPQVNNFSGAQGMQNMNQLYGLLAQYADNPAAVGKDYASTVQYQQMLDRQNTPEEKFLRMYGAINPYDWTAESLQDYHDNYVRTGQMQFDLLKPKKSLSSQSEKAILDADVQVRDTGGQIARVGSLIDGFNRAANSGTFNINQGLAGRVDEFFTKYVTGSYDELNAFREQYRGLKNEMVIQNLPPGVASDRDIALAREGWPSDTASPAHIASFLRGVQKMQVVKYAQNTHRANYLSMYRSPEGMTRDWQNRQMEEIRASFAHNGLRFDPMQEGERVGYDVPYGRAGYWDDTSRTLTPDTAAGIRDLSNMSSSDLVNEALR